MSYQAALEKAWTDLSAATGEKRLSVKFLSDTYDVDIDGRKILSASCNVPAKDFLAIIILHYLTKKTMLGGLPEASGEWIDFTQLESRDAYYPIYRKRTIGHIIRKFGSKPSEFTASAMRFPTRPGSFGDIGIIIYPFEGVGILFTLWKGDDEFGPDANILYDRNISSIFCSEDIIVLTEIVVHQL